MASTLEPKILSYKADAAISKGMAVKLGTDTQHVAKGAANTDKCIGIAQSAPTTAEDIVEVAVPGGGAKGLLGETVTGGELLVSGTDGRLVKANNAGDHVVAKALDAGVANDLIDVMPTYGHAAAAE